MIEELNFDSEPDVTLFGVDIDNRLTFYQLIKKLCIKGIRQLKTITPF